MDHKCCVNYYFFNCYFIEHKTSYRLIQRLTVVCHSTTHASQGITGTSVTKSKCWRLQQATKCLCSSQAVHPFIYLYSLLQWFVTSTKLLPKYVMLIIWYIHEVKSFCSKLLSNIYFILVPSLICCVTWALADIQASNGLCAPQWRVITPFGLMHNKHLYISVNCIPCHHL